MESFNPWSPEILSVLKDYEGQLLDSAEEKNEDDLAGRFHSPLDRRLVEILGSDYLVQLSAGCFRDRVKTAKNYQLTSLMAKCPEEALRDWSDLNSKFAYVGSDIPRLQIPVGTRLHFRTTVFRDLTDLSVFPLDEPYFSFRRRLCDMLQDYCESPELDPTINPDFTPKYSQVCLVRVPTWKFIDSLVEREKGRGGWRPKYGRRSNAREEDEWQAGKWFRGVRMESSSGLSNDSSYFEFWLVDVGRYVPVTRGDIVPAVFRFVNIPGLAFGDAILMLSCEYEIPPDRRREKWYQTLHKGTVFPATVLGYRGFSTLISMPVDIEQKFQDSFKDQHPKEFQSISSLKSEPQFTIDDHVVSVEFD